MVYTKALVYTEGTITMVYVPSMNFVGTGNSLAEAFIGLPNTHYFKAGNRIAYGSFVGAWCVDGNKTAGGKLELSYARGFCDIMSKVKEDNAEAK